MWAAIGIGTVPWAGLCEAAEVQQYTIKLYGDNKIPCWPLYRDWEKKSRDMIIFRRSMLAEVNILNYCQSVNWKPAHETSCDSEGGGGGVFL